MAVNPNMSDADRLAQIMQGNLAGQLTGGDKLTALSALLRSVSRGRTQTPEQVFQSIQQQKAQEVQSRLQMEQLRKQAEQQAQMNAVKAQYISQLEQTNPQLARAVQLMSADDFAKLIVEQNKVREISPTSAEREAVSLGLKPGSDAYKAYITQRYSQPQFIQTPQGTMEVPGLGVSYKEYQDPETKEIKRAIVIGEKAYAI